MITTFGTMPTSVPPGFFKAINFPILALMNKKTGDGRMLDADGGRSRDLPLSIRTQVAASFGHEGAEISGTLFEVSFDPDAHPDYGVVSGRGFLLDDEMGRKTARYMATKAMNKNSVDLAEVKARYEEDLETGEYWVRFTQWALAATTIVATPAFAEAYGELENDDEVFASLMADPMEEIVASFEAAPEFVILQAPAKSEEIEITASGAIIVPFNEFYVPEADRPQKSVVTADRRIFGHLGLWESCHDGFEGQCLRIPRPVDAYASFNKPGVLTERGIVQTGPIFAYGGHRPSSSAPTIEQAYGGVENAWADVRITEGVFGPWISGVVRPHVTEEQLYALRASRLSGHWVGGRLKAIVSVNAEGFDVPGTVDDDLVAGFAFSYGDEGVAELVASFPPCLAEVKPPPLAKFGIHIPDGSAPTEVVDYIAEQLRVAFGLTAPEPSPEPQPEPEVPVFDDRSVLLRLLAEGDD